MDEEEEDDQTEVNEDDEGEKSSILRSMPPMRAKVAHLIVPCLTLEDTELFKFGSPKPRVAI